MNKLRFTIQIQAPKQKVWDTMLNDQTYRQWTNAFQAGSYYEGSWDKGSSIRFLAPDDDGKLSGMFARIAENTPYQLISIEHLGEIIDGQEDTTSENAQQWAGAHETYRLSESDGVTTVTVELDGDKVSDETAEMLEPMWEPALAKLKDLAEA